MRFSCSVVAIGLAAGAATAQSPRTFGKPQAEFPEPFSQIASVRELPDGRVILVDTKDNLLQVVDFRTNAVRQIGRQGSGPGEWQSPTNVYPLLGDSTLVQDPANSRFLIIGPDATPARVFIPRGGSNGTLRAVDTHGLMYYQTALIPDGKERREATPDSSAIVRYDPVAATHDTLAFASVVRPPLVAGSRGGTTFATTFAGPFAPADDWNIFPDGRLVIARVADYHVDILAQGAAPVRGAPVRFTPVPVTEADKEAWRQSRRNTRVVFRGRDGSPMAPPPNIQSPDPTWHAVKPPFLPGATRTTPGGEIWIQRSVPAGQAPVYDVFNARGERTGQVALPGGHRLIGFGAGTVFIARVDDDGFNWLQRYALP